MKPPPAASTSALSWRRWQRSAGFAWAGLRHTWQTQANFRVEVVLGSLAATLCWALRVSPAPVLLCCALVLSLELVNTALEALTDLISPEQHPAAKIAKDAAAGAVLLASVISVVVGLAVFVPPLWRVFSPFALSLPR
ncbi:diacylglycerol kinase [Deinococcus psychrotolerans]|uniref:Diacylglycerol kinase n=1 Tax=Deinococcus psychrotolerans TaxID=2489213 RepID=A0A3G8YE93_9DEIO|nr:diacylglycerol kinase [Deinococcus psychrotolerans]AZI42547.1 diacylglycerol kinase [Deinococcus psychrotolerans]